MSRSIAPAISLRTLEYCAIILFLLMFSQALLGRLFASEENPEGGAFLRYIWLPIYGYAVLALALRWRNFLTILLRSPGLTIICLMAVASMLWSIDPGTSLRRGIAIFFTTMFGFYIASALSWREMITILGIVWIILGIGNFLAGALVPGFGVMHEIHVGAWRGLWFEKNAMGGNFARAAFIFGFLLMMDKHRRKIWGFGFILSVMLVLLSTSKTSLLGMLLGFGVLVLYLWMQQGKLVTVSTLWLILASSLAATFVVILAPEVLVKIIGRDLTFTGRTYIWEVLIDLIGQRPVLGYGYGAFWGEYSAPANMVRTITEWPVPTAHNGIIEVALAIGWLGVAIFLFDFVLNFFRAAFTVHKRPTSLFALGIFLLFVLFSISESVIMQQNSLAWVSYSAIVGRLSIDARERVEAARRVKSPPREISNPLDLPVPALRGRLR